MLRGREPRYLDGAANLPFMQLGHQSMLIRPWTGIRWSPYRGTHHEHCTSHSPPRRRAPGRPTEGLAGADPRHHVRRHRAARRVQRARRLPCRARRRRRRGGHLRSHRRRRGPDVCPARAGRDRQLRRRLRHHRRRRRRGEGHRGEQHPRRADRLRRRHRGGTDDRHHAPVLGRGPLRQGRALAHRGQLPADASGQQPAGRHHRSRSHWIGNRQAAQRLRLHHLLPQPQREARFAVPLRRLPRRAGARRGGPRRCGGRWQRHRAARRRGRPRRARAVGVPDQHRPRQRRRSGRSGRGAGERRAGGRRARRVH